MSAGVLVEAAYRAAQSVTVSTDHSGIGFERISDLFARGTN